MDLTLMSGDLRGVPAAIALSRATMRAIKQNLFWAFIYNLIGIPIAALGLLNPIIATTAMAYAVEVDGEKFGSKVVRQRVIPVDEEAPTRPSPSVTPGSITRTASAMPWRVFGPRRPRVQGRSESQAREGH